MQRSTRRTRIRSRARPRWPATRTPRSTGSARRCRPWPCSCWVRSSTRSASLRSSPEGRRIERLNERAPRATRRPGWGVGALLSAVATGLGVLILGNSVFEGVGPALLIPPVYILTTLAFTDLTSRAKAFGAIMGMGGIGAAAGPLIGGLITTAISWRAAFVFQALVVAAIVLLSRRAVVDPLPPDPERPFDTVGAVLSAVGLFCLVFAILQIGTQNVLAAILAAVGAVFLLCFFVYIRRSERAGREPLLSTSLFKNRTSNLALVTQNIQWLILLGTSFVVAVFLQEVRGYNAIETGVV